MHSTGTKPAPAKAAPVKTAPAKPALVAGMRYVARQPIFDTKEKVVGYELLFRDGVENACRGDFDAASRSTVDSTLLIGIDVLCDGRRAFMNCTRDTLLKGFITLLPAATTVVEILETIAPDPEVIEILVNLKRAGYAIALDDYVDGDSREPLVQFADIIKVDMLLTTEAQRGAMVKRFGTSRRKMLAEKVETYAEFKRAKEQGFSYFQGYFFRHPEMMSARDLPVNRLNYLQMLQIVSRPELDFPAIEKLIKAEAAICYRLLRYLNSAIFAFKKEIHSVRHALAMLGENDVRRWVRLVATVGAGQEKASDLILSALVRGRFGELLAQKVPHGESDLFLVGLFSLIDAMLEMPMEDVLSKIAVDRATKAVLLGEPGALTPVYELIIAHEKGEWGTAAGLCSKLRLNSEEAASLYWDAQVWAKELLYG